MLCPSCGKELTAEETFCGFCGRKLEAVPSFSKRVAPEAPRPPIGERKQVSPTRRRNARLELQIPLVVKWVAKGGSAQEEIAQTLLVSAHGCLVGLKAVVFDGTAVELVNRSTGMARKGRVTFLGGTASDGHHQIGIDFEEPDPNFWGAPYVGMAPWTGEERRLYPRYKQGGSVELIPQGMEFGTRAELSDISRDGCYVNTMSPLPAGISVRVTLELVDELIRAEAIIRASHPAVGMGLQFTRVDEENQARLDKVLAQLAA